ncbi:hypothetical protein KVQ89_22445, partial [Escherichia fergusonii]|nr:hypothetical protein [Escherichia fergusonii]
ATYNPIFDDKGMPYKIVKFAFDVTAERMERVELEGRVAAVERSQASIDFALDGTILDANENFLELMGYTLDEIRNDITGETPAAFEPTLDYVVVKVPRFAFEKFPGADPELTTTMK